MEINKVLENKIEQFLLDVGHKTDFEKSLFHYNSVLNLSQRILLFRDKKANLLKQKLVEYFNLLDEENYSIDNKYESSKLHNKYILPIEQYLIKKDQFITYGDLHLFIIIGFIVDLTLYIILSNYYYPIFILVLFLSGYYRRKQAQKNNKYSRIFW